MIIVNEKFTKPNAKRTNPLFCIAPHVKQLDKCPFSKGASRTCGDAWAWPRGIAAAESERRSAFVACCESPLPVRKPGMLKKHRSETVIEDLKDPQRVKKNRTPTLSESWGRNC